MTSIDKLKEMIEPITASENVVLYDVLWTSEDNMKILRVSILGHDGKMDIETCAKVSSLISEKLDVLDTMDFEYYLEVCSPGAERELRSANEIEEALSKYVYVKFNQPTSGLDEVYGYLREANNEEILVEYLDKTRKKKVVVSTNNINNIRLAIKL